MQLLTPEQTTELQAEVHKLAQELVAKIVATEIGPLKLDLRKTVVDLTTEASNIVTLTDKRNREVGGIINQRLEPLTKRLQDHAEDLSHHAERIEKLFAAVDVIKGQAAQAAKSVGCVDAKLHILDGSDKAQAAQLAEQAKSLTRIDGIIKHSEALERRIDQLEIRCKVRRHS